MMEAEEVFASLAIPLMKLVGLKTAEMSTEGRFSTIIIQTDTDSLHQVSIPKQSNRNFLITLNEKSKA